MNNLKKVRIDNNKTLVEVSKNIGVAFQTLSNYENGTRDIPTEKLIKLSNFYGVTIDYLLGVSDNRFGRASKEMNKMPVKTEFKIKMGNRIKYQRERHNLTQEELAQKLNISRSSFVKYEVGINEPSGEMLIKISKELNVSPDYLLGYTRIPNPVKELNNKLCKYSLSKTEFDNVCRVIRDYYSGDEFIIKGQDFSKLNQKENLAFLDFFSVTTEYFNNKLSEELGEDFDLFNNNHSNQEKEKMNYVQAYIHYKINDIINKLDKEKIINGKS